MKPASLFILFFFGYIPATVAGFETRKFQPMGSLGVQVMSAYVLEHDIGYNVYGFEAGFNLKLAASENTNLSIEPVFGIGCATPTMDIRKVERLAQSVDVAFLIRHRERRVHLGFGWVSGFTNISYDYFYWGYFGITGRFGVQISKDILLEAKGNMQLGPSFYEGKFVAGLSLIWLKS